MWAYADPTVLQIYDGILRGLTPTLRFYKFIMEYCVGLRRPNGFTNL